MRKTKKKDKEVFRPRNWVALLMAENTRNTVFADKRREDSKKKCRRIIEEDE
jgi:hypothetical protein